MAFPIRLAAAAVVLLALLLSLLAAIAGPESAAAARYVVAQCGWHTGHDANWAESGGFSRSAYCQAPASADPFDGVHLASQVRGNVNSVRGNGIALWRWQAPAGTGIAHVQGHRWQVVRDGFQHRLGGVSANGSFTAFLALDSTDTVKRDFRQGFSPFVRAFDSRLVCYRPSDRTCNAAGSILSGVRALTITLDDPVSPTAGASGIPTGRWLRGVQRLTFSNRDTGSGLRYAETAVDAVIRGRTEMNCGKVMIAGQWRGTRMQPCPETATGVHALDTRTLADGQHTLGHCAIDFAGNYGCVPDETIRVDNNAPAAPRGLTVVGGDGWRRNNGFDLSWVNPSQAPGAPLYASVHRISGPGGYSAAPSLVPGAGGIEDIQVPGPGEYRVWIWLADQAGNSDERRGAEVTLRFDDVPPGAYFEEAPADDPGAIRVPVSDRFSGVAGGQIALRPAAGGAWQALPTVFTLQGGQALTARVPDDLPPGNWVLRAAVMDRAGNATVTDRRANGSQMTMRTPLREETMLTAGLTTGAGTGRSAANIAYGQRGRVSGRLTGAGGRGIPGAGLTLREVPYPGSRRGSTRRTVRTDQRGFYELWLEPGPGRRLAVEFPGNRRLQGSGSGALELRVRGRLSFGARPRGLRTGQRVNFRGRVLARGAWHPARGNLVQVQYFEESARRWRPVLLTRTNRKGVFRAAYRFRYITGVARIRLRAVLVPSARFPYGGSASKPVLIRVRG